MNKKNKGFSLIEIMIALAVSTVALVAFLTVFTKNNSHAVGSRNRTVAILMAQSLMDDMETHTYGQPAPRWWEEENEAPVTVWVGGREQKMDFQKTITYENGSFIGDSSGNSDLVTITIHWREDFGNDQAAASSANKELLVRVPVWR